MSDPSSEALPGVFGRPKSTEGADRPDETPAQRADRNFGDLLQELRVAQTGVQILLAFLLTVPFAAGFTDLDTSDRRLFATSLTLAAVAMALLVAPVACHRLAFRRRRKELVLAVSHVLTLAGLVVLAVSVLCALFLAVETALGVSAAWTVTGVGALAIVVCWVVLPLYVRVGTPGDPDDD